MRKSKSMRKMAVLLGREGGYDGCNGCDWNRLSIYGNGCNRNRIDRTNLETNNRSNRAIENSVQSHSLLYEFIQPHNHINFEQHKKRVGWGKW